MGISRLLGPIRRPDFEEIGDLQRPYDGVSCSSECAALMEAEKIFEPFLCFLHDQE